MKFLMCCTLVPEKYEIEIRDISNAANRFLTNLFRQMEKEHILKILSYISLSVSNEIKENLRHEKEGNVVYFFKSKKIIGSVLYLLSYIWKELRDCDYIVTYNVVYAWMLAPVLAKLRGKKSILILADYSPIESFIKKKQRVYARIQAYFMGKYDYVIGLSENTERYLKTNQKFMCMEGGISEEFYDYFSQYRETKNEKVTLMYSGILEKVTGIEMLIDAFLECDDDNIQLNVTGEGSLAEWIKDVSKRDNRIHYYGCIPYDEYRKKLSEADILINPRNMNLPENENNFPSKIMEYLATGKMVISTKFPGWKRYQKYITFCESDSQSLQMTIEEWALSIKKRGEQEYFSNREFARRFLWNEQVEAIINFLR